LEFSQGSGRKIRKYMKKLAILGQHCSFTECKTAYSGKWVPIFERDTVPSSSEWLDRIQ
jgi:hypothetical protein